MPRKLLRRVAKRAMRVGRKVRRGASSVSGHVQSAYHSGRPVSYAKSVGAKAYGAAKPKVKKAAKRVGAHVKKHKRRYIGGAATGAGVGSAYAYGKSQGRKSRGRPRRRR